MRREDQYKFEGNIDEGSVYAGASASSELQNYRRFLNSITAIDARRKAGERLLPEWWSANAINKCVRIATEDDDAKVEFAVEKHDIQEYYGQDDMPMQLRMFGEALDGTMVAGQSGRQMLEMRADVEEGGGFGSMMSVSM